MQQNNNNANPKRKRTTRDIIFYALVLIFIVGTIFLIYNLTRKGPDTLTYSELRTHIVAGDIQGDLAATPVDPNNVGMYTISGTYTKSDGTTASFTCNIIESELTFIVENYANQVNLTLVPYQENVFLSLLISSIPFILLLGVLVFFLFRSSGGNNKAFDFGKSTARLSRNKTVTFKDVAGCDEEKDELVEIIDFLKNPKKYAEIGARIPKGVLLVGPPGTGKTLLAKAVAGEANVPFFSISGSDFVEMFVGVGASRVRDMFKTAKENSPCIIFIDEIDAVGRQRGAGMGGGHDEREQTLNQLLVEMDGFGNNSGIIIMAATNRPDVLDPALLRPGRFDRQITISTPDVNGRTAILKVHSRNKHLDPSIKLNEVAQRTPGFSGADIENLLNEAALLAARGNRKVITIQDIDEAIDRVLMGPAKKSRKITDSEKYLIAIHEAGHAVIGLKLENSNIVQKVTIIPRGQAGGYNLMLPEEEKYLETSSSLHARITGYLGGRVAEEVVFNEISTGASNDFQMATKIARAMVTQYGMSSLGPIQYEQSSGSVFLGRDYLNEKNFSDQIALEIDKEVRNIIETCYEKAKKVITEHMDLLKTIADYLIKIETLTKSDIDEITKTGALSWYDNQNNEDVAPTSSPETTAEETPVVEPTTEENPTTVEKDADIIES